MLETATNLILDRLVAMARRDPRKTAMAAVVTFTMLLLSCHFLFRGPAPAPAAMFIQASSDNPAAELPTAASPGEADAMSQWLKEAKKPANRNLFALNLEDYPADASVSPAGGGRLAHDQKDQTLWDDVAKSMATQADHKREQDSRFKSLQRAAAKLRVEKIIVGPPARAQINGEMIEEGGTVASLRVLQISSDRITVEKDGITLDVPLSQ